MAKKNLRYISALSLISIFLIADVYQVGANEIDPYYDVPVIEEFSINKEEIAESEYEVNIGEEIKIYYQVDWKDNPENIQHLLINYGNATGLQPIEDNLDKGVLTHTFSTEGKIIMTLVATNTLELGTDIANLTINVVNSPPEFEFAFFTEDSVNNAPYNFEQDAIPMEWSTQASTLKATPSIHKKVLYLEDNSQTGESSAINSFTAQSQGAIEFWIYNEFEDHNKWEGNSQLFITFSGEGTIGGQIIIDIGDDQNPTIYSNSGDEGLYELEETTFAIYHKWNHIRLVFDCDYGYVSRFSAYLNEQLIGKNLPFINSLSNIDSLKFSTGIEKQGGWYIDSIAYSWEENYNIGDNFDTETALEDQIVYLTPIKVVDFVNDLDSLNYTWSLGTMDSLNARDIEYNWEKQGEY